MKFSKIILTLVFLFSNMTYAQTPEITSVKRNIATIIFCGLGGAVLGLSTLSFYGQPQEHIGNITAGFGLGIIGGTVYVTSQSTREQMQSQGVLLPPIKKGQIYLPLYVSTF